MRMMYISLRKVLIVGASTTAVLLAAAPAWADLFVVDYTGPGGALGADVFHSNKPDIISVISVKPRRSRNFHG